MQNLNGIIKEPAGQAPSHQADAVTILSLECMAVQPSFITM